MPLFIIDLIARLVGERFAKVAAWIVVPLAAGLLLLALKSIYDRRVIANNSAKVERTAGRADAAAADQRAEDLVAVEQAKGLRDAEISQAPDSAPSDARMRLNCERLRNAGRSHPACARFTSGGETSPAR
jgi:hypothetical protein